MHYSKSYCVLDFGEAALSSGKHCVPSSSGTHKMEQALRNLTSNTSSF